MTLQTANPMPATDCPSWCLEDHEPDWQRWVATAFDTRPIPAAGGGFITGPGTPLEEWLSDWQPYHRSRIVDLEMDDADRAVQVDLARVAGDPSHLYLVGEGALTAEQARRLAMGLWLAADQLESVGQR